MRRLLVICCVTLMPLPALAQMAQDNAISRMGPAPRDFWTARDGCENIPGQAHNSADCSSIDELDPNLVLPDKPLEKMTGAERNLWRSYFILSQTEAARRMIKGQALRLTDDALEGMVKNMAVPNSASGRIVRWTGGLCVRTQGLTPELNAVIDRRIRQIASMVGAPVADDKCSPNVPVFFEANPQAAVRERAQLNPQLFEASDGSPIAMLHPVQAWYASPTQGLRGNEGRAGGFRAITVVASADLLKQHKPATLADYIALLALTRLSSSDACQPVQTIANLLKEGCTFAVRSDAMTAGDLAFLLALYRAVQRPSAASQLGAITNEMKRALEGR